MLGAHKGWVMSRKRISVQELWKGTGYTVSNIQSQSLNPPMYNMHVRILWMPSKSKTKDQYSRPDCAAGIVCVVSWWVLMSAVWESNPALMQMPNQKTCIASCPSTCYAADVSMHAWHPFGRSWAETRPGQDSSHLERMRGMNQDIHRRNIWSRGAYMTSSSS